MFNRILLKLSCEYETLSLPSDIILGDVEMRLTEMAPHDYWCPTRGIEMNINGGSDMCGTAAVANVWWFAEGCGERI